MQGLDQTAQRLTEFTSSIMSLFIFLAIVGAVVAIFSTIRAYNRGEAEREFQAFMNSCFISCSLPREKRDPLKWDKKNIGKYFSL